MTTEPTSVRALKNRSLVPPQGWVFVEPTTTHKLSAPTYDNLVSLVMDHRKANGVAIGTIDSVHIEIEEQLCANMNPARCRNKMLVPSAGQPTGRAVTLTDVMNFLRVAASWVGKGFKPVEPEEAERRARICEGCEFNVESAGCAGCKAREFAANLATATQGLRTSRDPQLKACAVCGCENKAQVHYPLDVLAQGVTPDMTFPVWCWKRKTAAPTD